MGSRTTPRTRPHRPEDSFSFLDTPAVTAPALAPKRGRKRPIMRQPLPPRSFPIPTPICRPIAATPEPRLLTHIRAVSFATGKVDFWRAAPAGIAVLLDGRPLRGTDGHIRRFTDETSALDALGIGRILTDDELFSA
jgi:hypothetical protein